VQGLIGKQTSEHPPCDVAVSLRLALSMEGVECYLKALLRQKHSVKKIKEKFGHNTKRLVEEAEALEFVVPDKDREVFSKADTDAIIEARYIRTGAKNWPKLEELRHTCKRVRDGVGDLLFKAGLPVWL